MDTHKTIHTFFKQRENNYRTYRKAPATRRAARARCRNQAAQSSWLRFWEKWVQFGGGGGGDVWDADLFFYRFCLIFFSPWFSFKHTRVYLPWNWSIDKKYEAPPAVMAAYLFRRSARAAGGHRSGGPAATTAEARTLGSAKRLWLRSKGDCRRLVFRENRGATRIIIIIIKKVHWWKIHFFYLDGKKEAATFTKYMYRWNQLSRYLSLLITALAEPLVCLSVLQKALQPGQHQVRIAPERDLADVSKGESDI